MARRPATGRTTVAPFTGAVLDAAGAAVDLALIDMCTITRPDPAADPVFDDNTGTYLTPTITVYQGPCLFGHDTDDPRAVAVAEEAVPLRRTFLHVPLAVTDVREQDTVAVTASHDPRAADIGWTIVDVTADSTEPWRHLQIQEAL